MTAPNWTTAIRTGKRMSTPPSLRAAGNTVVKVNLNIDEVSDWCRAKGVPMTTATRAEFVAEKLETSTTRHNAMASAPAAPTKGGYP